ncbi:uncharacterized protein [Choristoneura fumiferana]|uniref:uncharacterized protein n=1 Tax=Choristoneura fumiferana TaxID=7141 RepID=UPI003D15D6D7
METEPVTAFEIIMILLKICLTIVYICTCLYDCYCGIRDRNRPPIGMIQVPRERHQEGNNPIPNGIPHVIPNGIPHGIPNGIPHGIPNGIPNGIPHGIPNGIPHGIPNGIPHGIPNGIPRGIPNGIPHGIPNGIL